MNDLKNDIYPEAGDQDRSETFHIALLAAYATGLHSVEAFIPAPVPWLRFGFANIITLTTLLLYGLKAGITVTLIRVFAGSLFTGTFLGPAFVLSLSGGIASTFVMWSAHVSVGRVLSPVGLSILGALTHNITQLVMAYLLFVRKVEAIAFISPIIVLIGTITGTINGIVTNMVLKKIREHGKSK
jgi:heptaprenyl diphosphate synthase